MSHSHDHDHDDHSHLDAIELRVRALESIFVEKGYVDPRTLEAILQTYEKEIGPRNGAKVVARSWVDPDYRARLAENSETAIAELGYSGRQGEHIVALFNTPEVHNVVVCTLCSCYPWPVLGLPPVWYKSSAYRSRVVIEPRKVLAEFGTVLPETTVLRVWDSTSEMRYLVVPMRPEGSDGMSEDGLADLVNRDSMIGTRVVTLETKA
jgi:nitrile hydratase subunit alpha